MGGTLGRWSYSRTVLFRRRGVSSVFFFFVCVIVLQKVYQWAAIPTFASRHHLVCSLHAGFEGVTGRLKNPNN